MAAASLKSLHLRSPVLLRDSSCSSSPAIPGTALVCNTASHPATPRQQLSCAGRLACCASIGGSAGRGSGGAARAGRGGGGGSGTGGGGGSGGLDGYEDLGRYGLDDFDFSPMFMPSSPAAAPFLPPFPEQPPSPQFSPSTASPPAQSPPIPATFPSFPLDEAIPPPPTQLPFASAAPGQVAGSPETSGSPGINIGLGAFPGLDFGGLGLRRGRKGGGEEGLAQQFEGLWGGRTEGARKGGVRGRRGTQGAGSRAGKSAGTAAGAPGAEADAESEAVSRSRARVGAGAGGGAGAGAASMAAIAAGALSSEEEEEGSGTWSVYLLLSADCKKTYVGVTMNVDRRVKQHNGEVVGGAKSTRAGRPWALVGMVEGFRTRSEAFQFEWRWKNPRTIRGDGSYDRSAVSSLAATTDRFGNPEPLVLLRRRTALEEARKSFPEWNHLSFTWNENTVHAPAAAPAPAAPAAAATPAAVAAAAAAAESPAAESSMGGGGLAGGGTAQLA